MACLIKGEGLEAIKKLENKSLCQLIKSLIFTFLSKPVAVDYTAVLFIYTFCFAEHTHINWTGSLATVYSHCCNHIKFSNDMYRHVPNCCRYSRIYFVILINSN